MWKINLAGDNDKYEAYVNRLKPYDIGRNFTQKYRLMQFNSALFERAFERLTEKEIFEIIKELEPK